MDAETISETLDYNSILMQMLAREDVQLGDQELATARNAWRNS
jgi:hypothetical protein